MKKTIKIILIVLLVLIVGLIAAPFIFRGQLEDIVKRTINENLNATVAWEDLDLSLFRSFPDAALTIHEYSVINKAPFEGDTLASGNSLRLDMGITQLFKSSGEPIQVDAILLNEAYVNIKVDSLGNANYDIAVKSDAPLNDGEENSSGGFQFDVQHYEINNSIINYLDQSTNTFIRLRAVNHEGTGDFSAAVSTLETQTEALASLDIDGVNYLADQNLKLTADIEMDLENQRYTFKENEAFVNQLPLVFEGFVQLNEDNNEVDLTFETPSSDFKNFLAVIPQEYAKNLDGVDTSGDFRVSGKINGIVDEEHIPMLDIAVQSNNASFKYPDLPKRMQNITIDAQLMNETGLVEDTYLRLGNVTFKIDQDTFKANGRIDQLTTNPLVDLALSGKLNLANIEQVYPLELEQDLNGMLTLDVTANFDMNSVEQEQYQNIKSSGSANLTNFRYTSPELPNPLEVSETDITFNPGTIRLERLNAQTGKTDLAASGSIQNLIPFLLSKQDLKGAFTVTSNTIDLNDFKVASSGEVTRTETSSKSTNAATGSKAIKIPSFLDASLNFNAGQVIYDDIVLKNVKGEITIQNETATLNKVTSDLFGGNIALQGNVSTVGEIPTFGVALDLNAIDIDESFKGLDLLQGLAPIAKALQGAINTKLELNGNLDENLSPVLTSLAGNALAQLLTVEVEPENMPLLSRLDSKLDFINLDDINLNNLQTRLTFNNGLIEVVPFDFNVKGITINVGGSHSLDNTMNYKATLDVPARYFGNKIGGALAQLSNVDLESYTVDLPITLTGSFNSPNVSVNTQQAVNNLTQKIVAAQKDKLKEEGKDKIKDALGGILGRNNSPQDSTVQDDPVQVDSTTRDNPRGGVVRDILGGILGRKKDSTQTKN